MVTIIIHINLTTHLPKGINIQQGGKNRKIYVIYIIENIPIPKIYINIVGTLILLMATSKSNYNYPLCWYLLPTPYPNIYSKDTV